MRGEREWIGGRYTLEGGHDVPLAGHRICALTIDGEVVISPEDLGLFWGIE